MCFRYDNELTVRQSVDADASGLRTVLDDLTQVRSDLEMQVDGLKDELFHIKKIHKEVSPKKLVKRTCAPVRRGGAEIRWCLQDLEAARARTGGGVNVEVEAAPQQDLAALMSGIRQHYETIAAKNGKELETWFQTMVRPGLQSGLWEIRSSQTLSIIFHRQRI